MNELRVQFCCLLPFAIYRFEMRRVGNIFIIYMKEQRRLYIRILKALSLSFSPFAIYRFEMRRVGNICSRHKSSPATIHADVRGMNCRQHELSPRDNLCRCSRHKLSPEVFALRPVIERSVVAYL